MQTRRPCDENLTQDLRFLISSSSRLKETFVWAGCRRDPAPSPVCFTVNGYSKPIVALIVADKPELILYYDDFASRRRFAHEQVALVRRSERNYIAGISPEWAIVTDAPRNGKNQAESDHNSRCR
jgi:hypothetical protein